MHMKLEMRKENTKDLFKSLFLSPLMIFLKLNNKMDGLLGTLKKKKRA